MACERYRDALSKLAAGAAASADVEVHLASCAACHAELALLRRALALVDAELEELETAEPSPALAARIRTAVAASEASSGHRLGWLLPGLAAAAALVVALTLSLGRTRSPEPERAADSAPSRPAPSARLPEPAAGPVAAAPVRRKAADERPPVERRRPAPVEPEVLVPPGEAAALLRLVALVHRDRLAPPALGAVGKPATDLAELPPIDIQPLEIVPLDPAEASGT